MQKSSKKTITVDVRTAWSTSWVIVEAESICLGWLFMLANEVHNL